MGDGIWDGSRSEASTAGPSKIVGRLVTGLVVAVINVIGFNPDGAAVSLPPGTFDAAELGAPDGEDEDGVGVGVGVGPEDGPLDGVNVRAFVGVNVGIEEVGRPLGRDEGRAESARGSADGVADRRSEGMIGAGRRSVVVDGARLGAPVSRRSPKLQSSASSPSVNAKQAVVPSDSNALSASVVPAPPPEELLNPYPAGAWATR